MKRICMLLLICLSGCGSPDHVEQIKPMDLSKAEADEKAKVAEQLDLKRQENERHEKEVQQQRALAQHERELEEKRQAVVEAKARAERAEIERVQNMQLAKEQKLKAEENAKREEAARNEQERLQHEREQLEAEIQQKQKKEAEEKERAQAEERAKLAAKFAERKRDLERQIAAWNTRLLAAKSYITQGQQALADASRQATGTMGGNGSGSRIIFDNSEALGIAQATIEKGRRDQGEAERKIAELKNELREMANNAVEQNVPVQPSQPQVQSKRKYVLTDKNFKTYTATSMIKAGDEYILKTQYGVINLKADDVMQIKKEDE